MGMYKHLRNLWKKPKENLKEIQKQRSINWRKEPSLVRLKKPTRIDRARSLGYKAKQGYLVIRSRVLRGGHKRPKITGGRGPSSNRSRMILDKSYQRIAEERADRKYVNCEVLNSYLILKDSKYYWYEVILVDKNHPAILSDKKINWISERQHKGRSHRGLTASGKKGRGLRNKGKGAEKIRPSKSAIYKKKASKDYKY